MVSLNELRKQIARERKKVKAKRQVIAMTEEKAKLRKELFNLKHSNKIRVAKSVGKTLKTAGGNLKHNVGWAVGSFQKQRKSKKGIGGFMQRIADNQ